MAPSDWLRQIQVQTVNVTIIMRMGNPASNGLSQGDLWYCSGPGGRMQGVLMSVFRTLQRRVNKTIDTVVECLSLRDCQLLPLPSKPSVDG